MKSSIPDGLPSSIKNLRIAIAAKDNVLKKSADSNTFTRFKESYNEVTELAKIVTVQFEALKNDFDHNIINIARYKAALEPLNGLLTFQKIKIENFDAENIAAECLKMGY